MFLNYNSVHLDAGEKKNILWNFSFSHLFSLRSNQNRTSDILRGIYFGAVDLSWFAQKNSDRIAIHGAIASPKNERIVLANLKEFGNAINRIHITR